MFLLWVIGVDCVGWERGGFFQAHTRLVGNWRGNNTDLSVCLTPRAVPGLVAHRWFIWGGGDAAGLGDLVFFGGRSNRSRARSPTGTRLSGADVSVELVPNPLRIGRMCSELEAVSAGLVSLCLSRPPCMHADIGVRFVNVEIKEREEKKLRTWRERKKKNS